VNQVRSNEREENYPFGGLRIGKSRAEAMSCWEARPKSPRNLFTAASRRLLARCSNEKRRPKAALIVS
jgi:hypothetical protein